MTALAHGIRDPWQPPLLAMIIERASEQGGVIGTRQLHRLGADRSAIGRLVRSRFLHRLHVGVYRVAGLPITSRGRLLAATLAYGPHAHASHASAPVAHGLITYLGSKVHVTLPSTRRPRNGITPHAGRLTAADKIVIDGVRATALPRTLLDIAATDTRGLLAVVLRQAGVKGRLDVRAVQDAIRRFPGHHGIAALTAALERRDPNRGSTASTLEDKTTDFLVEHRFPPAERNVLVDIGGGELTKVDFFWGWAMCCLEMDSREYHANHESFVSDRRISRRLAAAGYATPRATGAELDHRDRRAEFAADLWAIFDAAIARWWL